MPVSESEFEKYFEKLLIYFSGDNYHEDILAGKDLFYGELGHYEEDSEGYEQRLNLFFDWYLFSRELSSVGLCPAEYVLELADFEMSSEERELYESLAKTYHSIFEIVKIRGESVTVKDLFTGKKILMSDSRYSIGFNKDEIFDGRIFKYQDKNFFCKGFCFHPPQARRFILKEIKAVRKAEREEQESLMLKLMKMRFKVEQYKHLKIDDVYSKEMKVKF